MNYRPGLELFLEDGYQRLKEKRVGLVTNQTGLSRDLKANVDLFLEQKINLVALFGPEHGIRGNAKDRARVTDSLDPYTGLPVYSLYGKTNRPEENLLKNIDFLIFDIQDIGLRYYTYISTLFLCMESCAKNNIPLVVLDRLNPLGRRVEGSLLQNEFTSFEGLYPLPMRHGMTVGELALWANNELNINTELEIVRLEGWQGEFFDQSKQIWIPPSPNIPHFSTCLVYPITVFIEGTNLSEGRGTTKPFEYIGAPWIDSYELAGRLNAHNLSGLLFRPIYFIPTFSKHQDEECGGVQVVVLDRNIVDNNLAGLTILKTLRTLYPERFGWIKHGKDKRCFVDLLFGTDEVRKSLESGVDVKEIVTSWQNEIKKFISIRDKYLIY